MSSFASCSNARGGARFDQLLSGPLPQFELVAAGEPGRAEVERYVHDRFAASYGADVREFMPRLLVLRCGGRLSAVVGMRCASAGPLFVEHYTDHPIEQLLEVRGHTVARTELLEIGNLVSTWRGASQLLMVMLPLLAAALGYRWLVFTATPEVRKLISRLHFELEPLARADGERLGPQRNRWGSYYDSEPMVMAGSVDAALQRLAGQRLATAIAAAFTPQLVALAQCHAASATLQA
jgi:hypothetical protein